MSFLTLLPLLRNSIKPSNYLPACRPQYYFTVFQRKTCCLEFISYPTLSGLGCWVSGIYQGCCIKTAKDVLSPHSVGVPSISKVGIDDYTPTLQNTGFDACEGEGFCTQLPAKQNWWPLRMPRSVCARASPLIKPSAAANLDTRTALRFPPASPARLWASHSVTTRYKPSAFQALYRVGAYIMLFKRRSAPLSTAEIANGLACALCISSFPACCSLNKRDHVAAGPRNYICSNWANIDITSAYS